MPDNVGYTPGSGATVAADDVGGVLYQRVKISTGADGAAADISATNPLPVEGKGELLETLEAIRTFLSILAGTIGRTYPDRDGRIRVTTDGSSTAHTPIVNVTTVGTVSDVTALGTIRAFETIPLITRLSVDTLRRNISVS